jgi:hypothetical protein
MGNSGSVKKEVQREIIRLMEWMRTLVTTQSVETRVMDYQLLNKDLLWLGSEHPHFTGLLSLLGSHLSRFRIAVTAADDQSFVVRRERKR